MKALSSNLKDNTPEESIDRIVKIESMFKLVSGFLSLGFQLGVFFGAACLLLYCWRINDFPSGITLGESLSLLTISIGFSALLFASTVSLVSLGLKISPLWTFTERLILLILNKKNKPNIYYQETEKAEWLLAIPGAFLAFVLTYKNPINILSLLGLVWFAAVLWSSIRKQLHETSVLAKTISGRIDYPGIKEDRTKLDKERDKLFKLYLIAVVIPIFMLFLTNMPAQFLDRAFGVLGLRQESVELYVQAPYSIKIVKSGVDHEEISNSNGLIKVNNARVLLTNIGEKVIVDLPDGKNMLRFEIPKQYIL
ncbi:MAG: hypothetical protein ACFCU8_13235 [Thermosynechococcaceae cyanobacterium]